MIDMFQTQMLTGFPPYFDKISAVDLGYLRKCSSGYWIPMIWQQESRKKNYYDLNLYFIVKKTEELTVCGTYVSDHASHRLHDIDLKYIIVLNIDSG